MKLCGESSMNALSINTVQSSFVTCVCRLGTQNARLSAEWMEGRQI